MIMRGHSTNRSVTSVAVFMLAIVTMPAFSNEGNEEADKVLELSIIGNNELPRVSFNLPWKLPSVENREDQSPTNELTGILAPIEPEQHKKRVHFSRYLELDIPEFRAR